MDLNEARHAFVTGAASGIGRAIAEALVARGIAVTFADINEASLTETVAAQNGKVRSVVLDTRDRTAWHVAKEEAEAAFGPVDILINNAGIAPAGGHLADVDPLAFERVIAINQSGMFNGLVTFAASLRERGRGHIVSTSSLAGLFAPVPGTADYCASKYAVVAMSEVLRMELAPYGVGVAVLCPTLVATNLGANTLALGGTLSDPTRTQIDSDLKPQDVARMVLQAIEDGRFYIFTSDDCWDGIEKRHQAMLADYRRGSAATG